MTLIRKASLVILERDKKILLIRRCNTGFADGLYTLPSGKVDLGESFIQAAIRETFEEVNIKVSKMKSGHIMSEKRENEEWIHHFFLAKEWLGEVKNMEPHKCDNIQWFDVNNLPNNTLPLVKSALEKVYKEKEYYSEINW